MKLKPRIVSIRLGVRGNFAASRVWKGVTVLIDNFDRRFSYLRLSVTEKCNFRCSYCLPNGYKSRPNTPSFMTRGEIFTLASAFKDLGVSKIRLTGGEPTLRSDIVEIVRSLKQDVGIESVAMTTNGFRLSELLIPLKNAGLSALNISLDSLNADIFQRICGSPRGADVRNHIDRALSIGFEKVKVNCVLMKGVNDIELDDFLEFVKHRDVSIRFIELMRTGDNKDFFERHHADLDQFEKILERLGWAAIGRAHNSGPAREFSHSSYKGRIGLIAPYQKDFCNSCNRLRVSAQGGLRLCLFGDGEISLRPYLSSEASPSQLQEVIRHSLRIKPSSHKLHEHVFGMTSTLSAIGG